MKTSTVLILAAGLLSTTACVPPNARRHFGAPKALARMECPRRQGPLTLRAATPDGASCSYQADDGSQVDLRLVQVANGDVDAALSPIEAQLRPLVGQTAEAASDNDEDADAQSWTSDDGSTSKAAAKTEAQARADARRPPHGGRDDDHVDINLPGVHIQADNGRANVNVAGVHVNADDATNNVHVEGTHGPFGRPGSFTIDANDGGAIIRARSVGPDVRATLIIAGETAGPQGWRSVGYQVRGPRQGPLVVAIVRSREDGHDPVFEAAKRLASRVAAG